MPAAAVPDLCRHLDLYARDHLSVSDFEPVLKAEADLPLDYVTPELYQALCRMEPFGMGNSEPIFVARDVRLVAPPQVMKDKHIKLRLGPAILDSGADVELNEIARAVMPRCHPDSAALPKPDRNWRKAITHNALGWQMAERFQQARFLPGDTLDIAFTLSQNDHPDFGGIELSLRDFKLAKNEESKAKVASAAEGVA
jgi:single-stranded-DNA-specific exonuclease